MQLDSHINSVEDDLDNQFLPNATNSFHSIAKDIQKRRSMIIADASIIGIQHESQIKTQKQQQKSFSLNNHQSAIKGLNNFSRQGNQLQNDNNEENQFMIDQESFVASLNQRLPQNQNSFQNLQSKQSISMNQKSSKSVSLDSKKHFQSHINQQSDSLYKNDEISKAEEFKDPFFGKNNQKQSSNLQQNSINSQKNLNMQQSKKISNQLSKLSQKQASFESQDYFRNVQNTQNQLFKQQSFKKINQYENQGVSQIQNKHLKDQQPHEYSNRQQLIQDIPFEINQHSNNKSDILSHHGSNENNHHMILEQSNHFNQSNYSGVELEGNSNFIEVNQANQKSHSSQLEPMSNQSLLLKQNKFEMQYQLSPTQNKIDSQVQVQRAQKSIMNNEICQIQNKNSILESKKQKQSTGGQKIQKESMSIKQNECSNIVVNQSQAENRDELNNKLANNQNDDKNQNQEQQFSHQMSALNKSQQINLSQAINNYQIYSNQYLILHQQHQDNKRINNQQFQVYPKEKTKILEISVPSQQNQLASSIHKQESVSTKKIQNFFDQQGFEAQNQKKNVNQSKSQKRSLQNSFGSKQDLYNQNVQNYIQQNQIRTPAQNLDSLLNLQQDFYQKKEQKNSELAQMQSIKIQKQEGKQKNESSKILIKKSVEVGRKKYSMKNESSVFSNDKKDFQRLSTRALQQNRSLRVGSNFEHSLIKKKQQYLELPPIFNKMVFQDQIEKSQLVKAVQNVHNAQSEKRLQLGDKSTGKTIPYNHRSNEKVSNSKYQIGSLSKVSKKDLISPTKPAYDLALENQKVERLRELKQSQKKRLERELNKINRQIYEIQNRQKKMEKIYEQKQRMQLEQANQFQENINIQQNVKFDRLEYKQNRLNKKIKQNPMQFEEVDKNITNYLIELNKLRQENQQRNRQKKKLEIMERMKKNELRKIQEQKMVKVNNQYVQQFKSEGIQRQQKIQQLKMGKKEQKLKKYQDINQEVPKKNLKSKVDILSPTKKQESKGLIGVPKSIIAHLDQAQKKVGVNKIKSISKKQSDPYENKLG